MINLFNNGLARPWENLLEQALGELSVSLLVNAIRQYFEL